MDPIPTSKLPYRQVWEGSNTHLDLTKSSHYHFCLCHAVMHISSNFKQCLEWFQARILERCVHISLLSYYTPFVSNWFLQYPNCWATSGEGEGGNLRGTSLISFLINGSLLPNAAIRENPANLKHFKMERLNIPQRKANGIQSFSPPGHKLKSGSSQKQQDYQAAPQLGGRMLSKQLSSHCQSANFGKQFIVHQSCSEKRL